MQRLTQVLLLAQQVYTQDSQDEARKGFIKSALEAIFPKEGIFCIFFVFIL
jgi:hypothetical protein